MYRIERIRLHPHLKFLSGLLLVVAGAATVEPARADQLVVMKRVGDQPKLLAMAHDLYDKNLEVRHNKCWIVDMNDTDPSCPKDWRRFQIEQDVFAGEAKLSGGKDEERLFVVAAGPFCGSAGCDFKVMQKQGAKWRVILDDAAAVPLEAHQGGVDVSINVLDQKIGGYHLICSGFLYVWDGKKYDEVFRTKQDAEDGEGVTCYRRAPIRQQGAH
jgi:hypothetical protein